MSIERKKKDKKRPTNIKFLPLNTILHPLTSQFLPPPSNLYAPSQIKFALFSFSLGGEGGAKWNYCPPPH